MIVGEIKNGQVILREGEESADATGDGGYSVRGSGKPRVQTFYHGTSSDFRSFNANHPEAKDAGFLGLGTYVATSGAFASTYARTKHGDADPNVMPLAIKGSRFLKADSDFRQQMKAAAFMDEALIDAVMEKLKAEGFDGVVLKFSDGDAEIVVFDSTNIRSINATFDPKKADSNNILFSQTDSGSLCQASNHQDSRKAQCAEGFATVD